jgi:hypothetical protein
MEDAISNYIIIRESKKSVFSFDNTPAHEANIYTLLVSLGFSLRREYGRIAYYRTLGTEILPVGMADIRMAFRDYLRQTKFSDLPDNLEIGKIIDWFMKNKRMVRENDHFRSHLEGIDT